MLVEIGMAVVGSIAAMITLGTFVRGVLNMSSAVNYVVQQVGLAGLAYAAFLASYPLVAVVLIFLFPILVRLITNGVSMYLLWRVARGDYGEEAKWAYELFKEQDADFVVAQANLPEMHVREVSIIADSKQEFRDLMVERYEEWVEENT